MNGSWRIDRQGARTQDCAVWAPSLDLTEAVAEIEATVSGDGEPVDLQAALRASLAEVAGSDLRTLSDQIWVWYANLPREAARQRLRKALSEHIARTLSARK